VPALRQLFSEGLAVEAGALSNKGCFCYEGALDRQVGLPLRSFFLLLMVKIRLIKYHVLYQLQLEGSGGAVG
jgi:hypothetical protein